MLCPDQAQSGHFSLVTTNHNREMKLRKYFKSALRVATDVIPKIPTKDDNLFAVVVKAIGIVDSITKITAKGSAIFSFFESIDATEITNGQFVDLFFDTPVHEAFDLELFELDDYRSVRIAHNEDLGTLYFVEYRWGSAPEVADDFWASPGFPFDTVLECLWDVFNGQIHVEVKQDEKRNRPRISFSEIPQVVDPIIGKNAELLDRLEARHVRFVEKSEPCVYLFLGMQGAGKTTMAQRFAKVFDARCMRVDAGGLTAVGVRDLDFLVRRLKPSFLLVDDIDKCGAVKAVLPTLLSLLSDLRSKHPDITVVLTAASAEGLDPALVRPRRIDKIVEFTLPDENERMEILKEYGVSGGALQTLAHETDGLTAAYLQGVAMQLRCGDPLDEVRTDVERMKTLASSSTSANEKSKS